MWLWGKPVLEYRWSVNDLVFLKPRFVSIDWFQLASIFNELITNRSWYSTDCTELFIYLNLIKDPRWIWKRIFISMFRPTVHANPSRKRSFSKTLFKPEEFENAGFAFVNEKHFENRAFFFDTIIIMWFPPPPPPPPPPRALALQRLTSP